MKLDFILTTPRLYLRPYKIADVDDNLSAVLESQPDLKPWVEWCHDGYDQQDAHAWLSASQMNWKIDNGYELAIFTRRDDKFLGTVCLNNLSQLTNSAELGYWIRSSCHRQGYATEAIVALARFAFDTLALTRLEIVVHITNTPSQKTAERTGALFESLSRNRIYTHGKACDGMVYSLIPQDLAPKRNRIG
ncbi:GNAT family N-acetyltransferase [Photobacterium sp. WH77]|uniref:GNAT family N-acetyltransferase n=1 Tax=Photobacterium TaxID=657 RepID=UPI001C4925A6|nr:MULTISPECIES: GNAT family N-acetyltransferase [Photobacterium]MBV7260970.1 GNAT family N-acetyltransferase [Photobacterium sp. WH24]MCG2838531.1 GNAT family N-acetyltransferase [Photobacterium sp. WH77]MCG2846097.1 GNAT family N-acetyltransferase [Photobacterium sp. WH80]MDO6580115.1 GNAT family N-acetyltransferase [Photobacterium sp. 2_MG-2023]